MLVCHDQLSSARRPPEAVRPRWGPGPGLYLNRRSLTPQPTQNQPGPLPPPQRLPLVVHPPTIRPGLRRPQPSQTGGIADGRRPAWVERHCARPCGRPVGGAQTQVQRVGRDGDHLASGGKDQLQSRIPSLDPLDATQVWTKRDAMNGHARRQIA